VKSKAKSAAPLNRTRRLALLKQKYFHMERANALERAIEEEILEFDATMLNGEHSELYGVVVIGESGSGKTTEINHALRRIAANENPLECGLKRRFVQLSLKGETTWKALGLDLMEELGYEMTARRTEHEIWRRARTQLKAKGIWLIHIDECQHMFQTLGESETKKVLNSLKTFMKHRDWPMVMILSGIPELLQRVNLDPQFERLMTPVCLAPIDPKSADLDELDTVFCGLAEAIQIDISAVRSEDIYLRMAYGCVETFGRAFRFMVDVLASLPEGQTKLTVDDLANRYAYRTGCNPGHNVFIREDYEACTVGILMPD
jgi:AAA domain